MSQSGVFAHKDMKRLIRHIGFPCFGCNKKEGIYQFQLGFDPGIFYLLCKLCYCAWNREMWIDRIYSKDFNCSSFDPNDCAEPWTKEQTLHFLDLNWPVPVYEDLPDFKIQKQ